MKLLTQELRKKLPALRSTEQEEDPKVVCKFFTPWSNWTWFVLEGEPDLDENGQEEDFRFFGLVHGLEKEFGYFSLNELQGVKGPFGLGIERDLYWTPAPLSEVDPEMWRMVKAPTDAETDGDARHVAG